MGKRVAAYGLVKTAIGMQDEGSKDTGDAHVCMCIAPRARRDTCIQLHTCVTAAARGALESIKFESRGGRILIYMRGPSVVTIFLSRSAQSFSRSCAAVSRHVSSFFRINSLLSECVR